MICKYCGATAEENAVYCGNCGTRLDGKKPCGKCGFFNDENNAFCVQCGTRIDGKKVCECGAVYDGNFCSACGKGAKTVHTKEKPVKEKFFDLEKAKKPLQLLAGALGIVAVLFSFIFLFCIGFEAPTTGESAMIYDAIFDGFKDVADMAKGVEDARFREFFNVAGYSIAGIQLFGALATVVAVITFATIATVRYIKNLLGKTDKTATKWCVATFLAFATGVAFLYSFNVAEVSYQVQGRDASTGSLVDCNGATTAGLVLGIICIAGALLCQLAVNFQKKNVIKYAFAGGLITVASILFCIVRSAGLSMLMSENGLIAMDMESNPLSFLLGFIVGLGTPKQELLSYCDAFLLKMDIYTIIFQVCVVLALVFTAIALYKTLRFFYADGKFALTPWIISVITSVALLVVTLLMRGAFQTLVEQTKLSQGYITVYYGWCIAPIIFSIVGLVGAIVGKKLIKNKEE